MPLGEIIGEVILRPILELLLYGISYWTGFIALKILTAGAIRIAPLTTITEKNRSRRKWHQIDWSIWLHRPMQGRALKAECTCVVGMIVWVAIGTWFYFGTEGDRQAADKTVLPAHAAPQVRSGWQPITGPGQHGAPAGKVSLHQYSEERLPGSGDA